MVVFVVQCSKLLILHLVAVVQVSMAVALLVAAWISVINVF